MSTLKQILQKTEIYQVRNKSILSKERVISVDALRGFDMFWIMGGDMTFTSLDNVFHNKISGFLKVQMDHVDWLGFHFYDIIMPLFMFLVGISMVYSTRKRLSSGASDKSIWIHTIKRFIILWFLGMLIQGNLLSYDIDKLQLYSNTLQAIASGYLIATILILYLPVTYQIAATLGLMLIYWAIAALIPFGGSTAGAYEMNTNIPLVFDRMILGKFSDGLQYSWIISSLNFAATTMLGVFCGYMMQSNLDKMKKFRNFVIFGVSLIVLALILNIWHPIIKKIWTSSFVLFAGGISVLLLAFFYLIIDVWNVRKGTKWMIVLGSNAIFGYVAWHLFNPAFIGVAQVFFDGLKPFIADWYLTCIFFGGFLVIYLLMWYMYRNKTFVKI
jgi:predicted acyltransferase